MIEIQWIFLWPKSKHWMGFGHVAWAVELKPLGNSFEYGDDYKDILKLWLVFMFMDSEHTHTCLIINKAINLGLTHRTFDLICESNGLGVSKLGCSILNPLVFQYTIQRSRPFIFMCYLQHIFWYLFFVWGSIPVKKQNGPRWASDFSTENAKHTGIYSVLTRRGSNTLSSNKNRYRYRYKYRYRYRCRYKTI